MKLKRSKAGMANQKSRAGNFLVILIIVIMGLGMMMPLYFTLVQSLKPINEMYQFPPKFYVVNPTGQNYKEVFNIMANMWVPFSRYIFNSLIVTLTATLLHLLFASMAAYPLAKLNFPGKDFIFATIMLALMFVQQVIFVPNFILTSRLGLLDTYGAYILPNISASIGLFLMKQFMSQLPDSLLEAARIDGASDYRTFFKIVLPNVKPAIFTVFIFQFVHVWNNTAQDVVYSEALKTVKVAMDQIARSDSIARYGPGMAASVLLMIPPIFVFILFQSNVVETMTNAGIKG